MQICMQGLVCIQTKISTNYNICHHFCHCKLSCTPTPSPLRAKCPFESLTLLLEASSSLLVIFLAILKLDLFLQKVEKCTWRLSLRSNSTTGWKSMCKRSAMTRHFWQHYINCWFTSSISIHKPFFWHHYTNLVCKISAQLQNYVSYWQTLICGFVLSWWQVMMLHSRLQEQQK